MSTFVKRYYGINIDKEASIGEGLYIGHFGGIYVGRCSIGKTCSIHQQTRIEDEVQIGNNVWIGGHSCIKKNIIIDDDATISSGSVVIRNINRCSLVKGNPARVVMARFDNTSLLVKSDNNIS
ncbi:MAG: hypothetical protein JXB49_30145 [Bacteroidales bacterium]|nr:hypothetical protein [Bacteroidales bacterium]